MRKRTAKRSRVRPSSRDCFHEGVFVEDEDVDVDERDDEEDLLERVHAAGGGDSDGE